jgi:hypothetical protein
MTLKAITVDKINLFYFIFYLRSYHLMDLDIYTTTKNWQFTETDEKAEEKLSKLEEVTRNSAP